MKNNEQAECKRPTQNSKVIRIEMDLVNELDYLSKITRTPIKDIASKAIRFALEYAVTKPVECFDVEFIIDANREG